MVVITPQPVYGLPGGNRSSGWRKPVHEAVGGAGNQSSSSATVTAPAVGNHMIVLSESEGGTNISSVTETNVVWSKLKESTPSVAPHVEVWIGTVSASPGTTVTVTYSGSTFCGFHVSEWAGLAGILVASGVITNVASGSTLPLVSPRVATALVIAAGAESTFGAAFNPYYGTYLTPFGTTNGNFGTPYAVAFGFPQLNVPVGSFPNGHSGTFSGVVVSIV